MGTTTQDRVDQTKSLILAEENFEEHPYFRLGDRNAGTGILRYESELRTKEGHVLKQSWTVMAAHGRGLPGRFDQDVYVALLQLIDAKGLPDDGWLSFSLYELVELMSRKHSGRDYIQVRESLQRLATTSVESKNAFYHRGRKEYISDTFSLLTQVKLSEYEDRKGRRTDRNRVLLSDYFVDSYKANYLKDIDTRLYWSLSRPIAKRLYRLIDKKRNGRRFWEAELFSLRARIPLSEYKYASKIKEKLSPAHTELINKGFLEEVIYRKAGNQQFVGYKITDAFQARRAVPSINQLTDEQHFCIQRLKSEGMATDTAEKLVADHGVTRAMHYVEHLPYQKNLRNPAGWLRRAIEEGYDLDTQPVTQTIMHNTDDISDSELGAEGGRVGYAPSETRFVSGALKSTGSELSSDSVASDVRPLQPASDVAEEEVREESQPDLAAREAWTSLAADLVSLRGSDSMPPWFGEFEGGELDGVTLTILVPNSTAANHLNTNFGQDLGRLWRRRVGEDALLQVCMDIQDGTRAHLCVNYT